MIKKRSTHVKQLFYLYDACQSFTSHEYDDGFVSAVLNGAAMDVVLSNENLTKLRGRRWVTPFCAT